MSRALALLRASHPEPTAAVTALSTALALSSGLGLRTGVLTAAVLTGQLSVGWSNDWIDAARDRRSGRADKPVARGEIEVADVRTAALVAAVLCVPLSLSIGLAAGLLHLSAVAAAWAYNAWLKATVLSWAPYALAFAAAPAVVTLGLPGRPLPPAWATLAGALLGIGAHLCNVLPDLEDDRAAGIRGLPHRLGPQRSAGLAGVALLAAVLLLALGPGAAGVGPLAAVGVATAVLAVGLVRARRPGSRAAFRACLVVAGIGVVLLVARGAVLVRG